MANGYLIWTCVHTVLLGVVMLPLFILGFMAFCTVRARGDPARIGFRWLTATFLLYAVALALSVASDILEAFIADGYYGKGYGSSLDLSIASQRIASTGLLLERVASLLFIVTFVEIGSGFLALSRPRSPLQRILRYLSVIFCVGLFAVALAYTVRINLLWYRQSSTSARSLRRQAMEVRRISAAFDIVNFVVSIGLLAYASMVMHKYRAEALTRNSAGLYLVAGILNFVRWTWWLVFNALWVIEKLVPSVPVAWYVLDPVFNAWIFFIVLVLLWTIGARKATGLWSTPQPFSGAGSSTIPPMGYVGAQQPQYGYGVPQQVVYQQQPGTYPQAGYMQQQPQYGAHTQVSPIEQHGSGQPYTVPNPGPEVQANGFYTRESKP